MPLDYELLDFGNGRKLERFGEYILDRPAPQTQDVPANPSLWSSAEARFESSVAGERGQWSGRLASDIVWQLHIESLQFHLRLTPFGQVGFFPEQMNIWRWMLGITLPAGRRCKVL